MTLYIVLHYMMSHCTILEYVIWYKTRFNYTLGDILYYTIPYYTIPYYIIYYTILYLITSYFVISYYITLHDMT